MLNYTLFKVSPQSMIRSRTSSDVWVNPYTGIYREQQTSIGQEANGTFKNITQGTFGSVGQDAVYGTSDDEILATDIRIAGFNPETRDYSLSHHFEGETYENGLIRRLESHSGNTGNDLLVGNADDLDRRYNLVIENLDSGYYTYLESIKLYPLNNIWTERTVIGNVGEDGVLDIETDELASDTTMIVSNPYYQDIGGGKS
ncbi:MAG: hypothetical protein AAGI66_09460 [Cyanobacteria bacterium P01_H01_bin.74]